MIPRVLVTGAGGMLGRACVAHGAVGVTHADCDVTSLAARDRVLDKYQPDFVVFCAAHTEVDTADQEGAWRVNVEAPTHWASVVPVVLVSSNYVFSGTGPHRLDAVREPLQAYGIQKRAAEDAVLGFGGRVVRTGWLYGRGGTNFPSSLPLRLRRGPVRAISDVKVQPTYCDDLARYLFSAPAGVSHAIGSEETTWYLFARAVAEHLGIAVEVEAIQQGALESDVIRPSDARLYPARLPGWSSRLSAFLADQG